MITNYHHRLFFIVIALMFSGCATPPFNLEGADRKMVPQQSLDDPSSLNKRVVWGGLIVGTRNFKDSSQIEVLSFPLGRNSEPQRSAKPQGRFLILQEGYLEPASYTSGRWISAIGTVAASQKGKVGEADYHYPVMRAENTHLWSESSESDVKTRFSIGIGISR